MTDIIRLCGVAVLGAVAITVCRSIKSEMTLPLGVVCGVALISYSIYTFAPVVRLVKDIVDKSEFSVYFGTVIKALGICLLTEFTSEFCKDCGAESLSGKIEFAGKALILLLSIPIIEGLITLAYEMSGL